MVDSAKIIRARVAMIDRQSPDIAFVQVTAHVRGRQVFKSIRRRLKLQNDGEGIAGFDKVVVIERPIHEPSIPWRVCDIKDIQ